MFSINDLGIKGSWLFEFPTNHDNRGYFREWYKSSVIKEVTGKEFSIAQANLSKSKKGVVRGIHFSTAPQGQAKWVTCANGSLWDVVVDIRLNSPTFKQWVAVELRAEDGKALFISEGLGHAFVALEDQTVISYLLSSPFSPKDEHAINPRDSDIGINWPDLELSFSEKDAAAPSLKDFLSSL